MDCARIELSKTYSETESDDDPSSRRSTISVKPSSDRASSIAS